MIKFIVGMGMTMIVGISLMVSDLCDDNWLVHWIAGAIAGVAVTCAIGYAIWGV